MEESTIKQNSLFSDLEGNIGDMDSFREGSIGWRREMSSRVRKMEIFQKRSRTTFNLCNSGDNLLIKNHAFLISQQYLADQTLFVVIFHQTPLVYNSLRVLSNDLKHSNQGKI